MILQSPSYESYCVEEFTAEIYILQHTSSSKLKVRSWVDHDRHKLQKTHS